MIGWCLRIIRCLRSTPRLPAVRVRRNSRIYLGEGASGTVRSAAPEASFGCCHNLLRTPRVMSPRAKMAEISSGRPRGLAVGASGTGAAIISGQLANGLTFVVLARRLGPEEFGVFAALYTAGLFLGGLLDFGSSQMMTRDLAQGSARDTFKSWLLRRTAAQLLPVALATAIALVAVGGGAGTWTVVSLVSQGVSYPVALAWSAAVRALRSPALGTGLISAGNLLPLGAAAVAPAESIAGVAAIAVSASWLVTALSCWLVVRARLPGRSIPSHGNPWSGSFGFGLFGLAVASASLQVPLIGIVSGAAAAGELAAVSRWTQPVWLIASALAIQAFPGIAAAGSDRDAWLILRSAVPLASIGLGVAGAIVLAAPLLVNVLLGSAFDESVDLLRLLAIATAPVLVNQLVATFLQARGREREVALMTALAVILILFGTAALATLLGAAAAPLASVIGQLFLAIVLVTRMRGFGSP